MTAKSNVSKAILVAALLSAMLGACRKTPTDQPATGTGANTMQTPAPGNPGTGTTPANGAYGTTPPAGTSGTTNPPAK